MPEESKCVWVFSLPPFSFAFPVFRRLLPRRMFHRSARIRLTVPCQPAPQPAPEPPKACVFTGWLAGWRTDAIDLEIAGRRSTYNLNTVGRLEVSRLRRSHWRLGAGIGFVLGAGGTFLVLHQGGSTGICDQSANQDAIRSSECLGLAGLGGLAGAGLGALIGGRFRSSERWQSVPHGRLRISLVTQGRFTLKLAVAF